MISSWLITHWLPISSFYFPFIIVFINPSMDFNTRLPSLIQKLSRLLGGYKWQSIKMMVLVLHFVNLIEIFSYQRLRKNIPPKAMEQMASY